MAAAAVDDMETSGFGPGQRIAFVRLGGAGRKPPIGAKGREKPFGKCAESGVTTYVYFC